MPAQDTTAVGKRYLRNLSPKRTNQLFPHKCSCSSRQFVARVSRDVSCPKSNVSDYRIQVMSIATKLRRMRKTPPEGWDLIEPTLEEFEAKMREAETDPHEGKRKTEGLWPVFRVSQR